jgi:predicted ATP-grasp superfamily ATP-dependent carboligase
LKVLVLGGWSVTVLPVLRTLKRRGLQLLAAVHEGAAQGIVHSRHLDGVVHLPRGFGPDSFESLVDQVKLRGAEVLLPLGDEAVWFLKRYRATIEAVAAVAMAPNEALEVALDKARTVAASRLVEGGIDVPWSHEIHDLGELGALEIERFPVLIKPRSSSGARGIVQARNRQELVESYPEVHRRYPNPLIQELVEYADGEKYQLFYLFDGDGELRLRYMHRILAQMDGIRAAGDGSPVRGGNALAWESCRDDDLMERGRELLAGLGWRGFAFIECVRDSLGRFRLLEINTRLSGTIALPLREGVDFAHAACLVALGRRPETTLDYRVGVAAAHRLRGVAHDFRRRRWRNLSRYLDPRIHDSVPVHTDPRAALDPIWQRLARPARRLLGR